jgi:hypothetical protein
MFQHAAQVFSRRPSIKKSSRKTLHLRDLSITSANSATSSSTASTVTGPAVPPPSSTSAVFSPTTIRHGPSSSPTFAKPSSPVPEIDPLSQHPTFGPPPPPLSERPLIQQQQYTADFSAPQPEPVVLRRARAHLTTIAAPKPVVSHAEWRAHITDMLERNVPRFPQDYSPRHTIHTSTPVTNSMSTSAQDYFVLKVPKRPELKSHWSASTIQSPAISDCGTPMDIDSDEEEIVVEDGQEEDEEDSMSSTPGLTPSQTPTPPFTAGIEAGTTFRTTATITDPQRELSFPLPQKAVTAPARNFSHKRCTMDAAVPTPCEAKSTPTSPSSTSPRRPQMKTMDSIDHWIKRGGWKRRGIVFAQGEGGADIDASIGTD